MLATKVWGQMSDDPARPGLSADQISKQIDASLRRLQTDYVDLYQTHRFDSDVPIEETIEARSRSSATARPATSASANGRRSRYKPPSTSPVLTCSSPPSHSTRCCGSHRKHRSSRSARPMASRRSCGHRWPRGVLTGKYKLGQALPSDSRAANDSMNRAMISS